MAESYYLLDTFTGEKCKGNPTPVCIPGKALPVQTMQMLAKEFNAPVTAFVEPQRADGSFPVRYFTITGEIPACGHATLGAATVLFRRVAEQQIVFTTIEKIQLKASKENTAVYISYPRLERTGFSVPDQLMNALGIRTIRNHFFCKELESLFIELQDENEVRQVQPHYRLLAESTDRIKEVVVMGRPGNKNYDYVLRSFCPWIGIDEDPVTGSVHSVLGHYWQEILHTNELIAWQASERGGQILVRPLQNTIEIGGKSEIILEGQLKL